MYKTYRYSNVDIKKRYFIRRERRLWTFALKTDLLVEMLLLFRYEFRAAFTVENIYDNKRNDIYYGENLNSSNYDKQDFEKRLNKILMLKIDWEFKT